MPNKGDLMKQLSFAAATFVFFIGTAGCGERGEATIALPNPFGTDLGKPTISVSAPVTESEIPETPKMKDGGVLDLLAQENPPWEDPNEGPGIGTGNVASAETVIAPTPPPELPGATPVPSDPTDAGDRTTWTISGGPKEFAAPLTPPPLELSPVPPIRLDQPPPVPGKSVLIVERKTEIAMPYHAD